MRVLWSFLPFPSLLPPFHCFQANKILWFLYEGSSGWREERDEGREWKGPKKHPKYLLVSWPSIRGFTFDYYYRGLGLTSYPDHIFKVLHGCSWRTWCRSLSAGIILIKLWIKFFDDKIQAFDNSRNWIRRQ